MGRRESADITAGELMDQLANDPEFQARERAEEEKRVARRRELNLAQRPLVADLKEVGAPVTESVYDLVNTSEPYPQALPVLVKHLEAGGTRRSSWRASGVRWRCGTPSATGTGFVPATRTRRASRSRSR